MSELGLFKKVYDQVLDYADDELISRCAVWGYSVYELIRQDNQEIVQGGAEKASPFMYAVATAVIIGEFSKRAYNDYFSNETGIDLDLLDIDFEQIRGFLEKDMGSDRFELLEGGNTVGLQDMWTVINEWKQHIHQSLVDIYKEEGNGNSIDRIFTSFVVIFEEKDGETDEVFARNVSHAGELSAYSYISEGFQY